MKEDRMDQAPKIGQDGKPIGLSTYQVNCKLMFYALIKIAAAYHREYCYDEVKIWKDNPELLRILKSDDTAHIEKRINP